MALAINKSNNVFYDYHTTVWISAKYKISTLNGVDIDFDCRSTMTGDSGQSYVTFYNLAPSNTNKWKVHDYISVWSGPSAIFGKFAAGTITKITNAPGDQDSSTTVYFKEAANDEAIVKPQDKSTKTVKGKKVPTKINHAFPKNTTAKAIIKYITSKTKIKIARLKLKTNKKYKRGYTLSKDPFQALQGIANDCNSYFYFRKDQLIFDDGKEDNPYKEHIYYAIGYGLISQPARTSQTKKTVGKGKKKKQVVTEELWTFQTWLDPRAAAGSFVQIQSNTLKSYVRLKAVDYKKSDDGYISEVQAIAKP